MVFTTRPTLSGSFGMVSSTHWLASQVAMGLLERGGNAFDAATGAGFVLHLVEPHLNGPGGEMPAIVAPAGRARPIVLCGQGVAPQNASVEIFRRLGLDEVPGAGPLAAVIPGAVDAWLLLLRDYGTMTLREVLEPAIEYANQGHPLVPRALQTIASVQRLFKEDWPTSAAVWLPGSAPPPPGTLFRRPTYGATLAKLVSEGEAAGVGRERQIESARAAWSQGFVAEHVDRFSALPIRSNGEEPQRALLTGSDMAGWQASWEEPVQLVWNGFTIAKTGTWGQGPVLLQTLAILQQLSAAADLSLSDDVASHYIVEAMKLAFADREAWYGDSAEPAPLGILLSSAYARERASLIGSEALLEVRPGHPGGRTPQLADLALRTLPIAAAGSDATLGEPTVRRDGTTRGDTCHVDVVDRWGNMISATPSGGWLQSAPVIPELGFPLGSRAQMFWLQDGLPASLVPGRRPRTTLSPTMVLRDDKPVMACGSPGGDQQDQWQLLFLLRTLLGGQSLQAAIDAPNFHSESISSSFYPRGFQPGVLVAERNLETGVLDALADRGHLVRVADQWTLGRLCVVTRDPDSAILQAAANPRGMQGYAVGR